MHHHITRNGHTTQDNSGRMTDIEDLIVYKMNIRVATGTGHVTGDLLQLHEQGPTLDVLAAAEYPD